MKTPPLSFIFVRSLSFHPSLLILSLSLSPFQQPFNPLPVRFASSRSSNFSLNRSYYVHPFPSIYFRLVSLETDQRQYVDDDDDDTIPLYLFYISLPPHLSPPPHRESHPAPTRHPLRQLVQTSSQTASKFLKARHRHRGEIGLFVPTPRIP